MPLQLFASLSSSSLRYLLILLAVILKANGMPNCTCTSTYDNDTPKRGQASASLDGNAKLHDFIALASYAPIGLFAESLRVQKALIQSIITPLSITPLLTGCVKDLEWLWNLDPITLFSGSADSAGYVAASMRHGNNFPLANAALLKAIKVTERPSKLTRSSTFPREAHRPTTVNVTFVVPSTGDVIAKPTSKKLKRQLLAVCTLVTLQCALQVVAATFAYLHDLLLETILLAIPTVNLFVLLMLRLLSAPKFADARQSVMDARLTVAGGAALDAHIVARNWNSSHIDVICGYSNHVHALTNIPVAVKRPNLLLWFGRLLAISLSVQAASLAYVIGRSGIVGLSAAAWLALYLLMLLPQMLLERIWPMDRYKTHVGNVEFAGAAQFTTRRSALAFIAMLPVSYRVDRWDWVDVFMPRNARREQWQDDLETCTLIGGSSSSSRQISPRTKADLVDAQRMFVKLQKTGQLIRFQQAVGL